MSRLKFVRPCAEPRGPPSSYKQPPQTARFVEEGTYRIFLTLPPSTANPRVRQHAPFGQVARVASKESPSNRQENAKSCITFPG